MTNAQPKQDELLNTQVELEEQKEKNAQLASRLAELESASIDNDPTAALAGLLKNLTATAAPKEIKRHAPQGPYILTDARKKEIEGLLEQFKDKGLEYKFEGGSVSFRKKIRVKTYDKETESWVKEDAWKAESVHTSSLNQVIVRVARLLVLI